MWKQVNLHHHRMIHKQKARQLKGILRQATTHPICYQMYHMTRIQIKVYQILFRPIQLTHHMISILNEYDVWK